MHEVELITLWQVIMWILGWMTVRCSGVDKGAQPPVSYTHLTLPTNREV